MEAQSKQLIMRNLRMALIILDSEDAEDTDDIAVDLIIKTAEIISTELRRTK